MNNSPDSDALSYLLEEMDAESRAAFERRLERDPEAVRAVREIREALAGFAQAAAPAEALPAADQRQALERIMSAVDAEPRRSPASYRVRRWAWPLAACLLLALNLWQFSRSGTAHDRAGFDEEAANGSGPGRSELAQNGTGSNRDPVPSGAADPAGAAGGAGSDGGAAGEAAVTIAAEELQRLRAIRGDYDQLEEENDRLRAENTEVLRQLTAYALTERGVNRIAAMELVDPASYAAGERKGLLDFARNLLTEPGIIALDPEANGAGNEVPTGDPTTDPTDPADEDLGAANQPPGSQDAGGDGTGGDTTDADSATHDPYAWSVFDETQQRGFLNLYNLPTPAAGQSLQLWVRTATDVGYTRVGEVPSQYYGGSGSITYALPGQDQPPAEILVTQEPVNAPPEQPTGPPVLRGP